MILILNWSFPMVLLILGLFCFVSNRKHLLSMLLSLEFIVLILFFMMFIYMSMLSFENYFSMMYLTFKVCEGALGLSILVSMIWTQWLWYDNDYFQSFSFM